MSIRSPSLLVSLYHGYLKTMAECLLCSVPPESLCLRPPNRTLMKPGTWQWAAVSTQFLSTSVPPQMNLSPLKRAACQGRSQEVPSITHRTFLEAVASSARSIRSRIFMPEHRELRGHGEGEMVGLGWGHGPLGTGSDGRGLGEGKGKVGWKKKGKEGKKEGKIRGKGDGKKRGMGKKREWEEKWGWEKGE